MKRTWLMADRRIKTTLVGGGLLLGSYLLAGLMNAAPIVQPPMPAYSRPAAVRIVPVDPSAPPAAPAPLPSDDAVQAVTALRAI